MRHAGYRTAKAYRDVIGQVVSSRLDFSTGRLSWDGTELTIDFATNARYDQEPIPVSFQINHDADDAGFFRAHVHWLQTSATTLGFPNLMLRYRTVTNGGSPSAWTNVAYDNCCIFTYTAGTLLQISKFPDITRAAGVSDFVDAILYRDSANASGLFAGADAYPDDVKIKGFDGHCLFDSTGSVSEYNRTTW
jgi:hypothetical protein